LQPLTAPPHSVAPLQLLTKIDGVDALNNILLIGMTNRWAWEWRMPSNKGGAECLHACSVCLMGLAPHVCLPTSLARSCQGVLFAAAF